MLKLINITKDYIVKGLDPVHALKGVTLNFRKNEMVAILGPSGCGKTTLLNIIGGLDRYTSGDLIIEGKSTKNYNDRDWDTYRNHSIGFVFQSYNLISHLSIIDNVSIALKIGGYTKAEIKNKAKVALDNVGLAGMYNKKPNQLSGGQMQRVAIARALVTNPDIVLADEPTGALDSETSVQIMNLLKEVAKDRLVVLVTHNPELAELYANRIITMKDGLITSDSNEFKGISPKQLLNHNHKEKPKSKSKMKLTTSFGLSFRNLVSKFKRTALVVVAGSIGIIGVSTVLAVSTGVKSYINSMQDDMLSGNPITIEKTSIDVAGLMSAFSKTSQANALEKTLEDGKVNIDSMIQYLVEQKDNLEDFSMNNSIDENYVRFIEQMPKEYYSSLKYEYGIDFKLNMFTTVNMTDKNNKEVGVNRTVTLKALEDMYVNIVKNTSLGEYASVISMLTDTFFSSPDNPDYILEQYDIISGPDSKIATEADEMMLVVSNKRELTDIFLGQLGYYTQDEFVALINKNADKSEDNPYNDVEVNTDKISYDDLIKNHKFYYVPNNVENSVFQNKSIYVSPETMFNITGGSSCIDMPLDYKYEVDDAESLPEGAKEIKITAILQPKANVSYGCLQTGLIISPKMEEQIIKDTVNSDVGNALNSSKDFYDNLGLDDGNKTPDQISKENEMKDVYSFLVPYNYQYDYSEVEEIDGKKEIVYNTYSGSSSALSVVNITGGGLGGSLSDVFSKMFGNAYSIESQFENTIRSVGGESIPLSISIYPRSFDEKYLVTNYLDKWNNSNETIVLNATDTLPEVTLKFEDREEINYNDNLELIISLIGTMIDIITIALLAFTSLSLVVSTVMIGIITYVSVIERVKEIGVIRSLGGRKSDVSNLFNAETFIIGLSSGLFGIGITYLLSGIINLIINAFAPLGSLIYLPLPTAGIVIIISIALTLISGLIPARAAARKDPVVALRTE